MGVRAEASQGFGGSRRSLSCRGEQGFLGNARLCLQGGEERPAPSLKRLSKYVENISL